MLFSVLVSAVYENLDGRRVNVRVQYCGLHCASVFYIGSESSIAVI